MENSAYRDVITDAHFESIVRLVGYKGLPVLVHHLTEHVLLIVRFTFH